MRTILVILAILVSWKIVRTDWIVISPWESYNGNPGSISGHYNATYRPPVSPAWNPPDPMTSGRLDFGSGNSYARGEPWIRPHWELIGLKIALPLILILSAYFFRFVIKRRSVLTDFTRGLIEVSKRQNKAEMATPRKPSD